ncbi:MAG: hypothetical protein IT384_31885 [Deltaproteobacteria bacterium]|nr:hypothetical protein [Deltaproteobacteria bacterium]
MVKAFETWTVLPHRPLEKLTENLWRLQGKLPGGRGTRVMTLARMRDGRVVVHNGIALEEELMKEIEAWGTPAVIAVPNGFHRLDAKVFKQRYPSAKVYCPAGSKRRVERVVAVDGSYEDAPRDETVRLEHVAGCPMEGVLEVRSSDGVTLVFNDLIANLPALSGFTAIWMGPTGRPSIPRVMRWVLIKDKAACRSQLQQLGATPDLRRLIVSHGKPVLEGAGELLRSIAATL